MPHEATDAPSAVRRITELATMLHDARPLADRVRDLCQYTASSLGCDRVSIMVWDGEAFRATYNWGNPPDIAPDFPRYKTPRHAPLISQLFDGGKHYLVINEARTHPALATIAAAARIDSMVLASMYDQTAEPLGFMTAEYNEQLGSFTELDAELVLGSARLAQGAIVADREWNHRLRLASEVHSLIENERRRLGRDLHDDAVQRAFALGVELDALRHTTTDEATAAGLNRLIDDCTGIRHAIRAIAIDAHPATATGSNTANSLARLVAQHAADGSLSHEVHYQTKRSLPVAVESSLFRIADQALSNVVRHAEARKVTVHVHDVSHDLLLSIRDDGVGFDPPIDPGGHLGLVSMREHASRVGGRLSIDSRAGRGTLIEARLPTMPIGIDQSFRLIGEAGAGPPAGDQHAALKPLGDF